MFKLAVASLLLLGACGPIQQEAANVLVFKSPAGYAELRFNTVNQEVWARAPVSTPAVCEGDSTNIELTVEVRGASSLTLHQGVEFLYVEEAHESGMTEMLVFRGINDTQIEMYIGVIAPNLPCSETVIANYYVLELQQ
jgi:hypothetical protein